MKDEKNTTVNLLIISIILTIILALGAYNVEPTDEKAELTVDSQKVSQENRIVYLSEGK